MGALWHDIQTGVRRAADTALTTTMNREHPGLVELAWCVITRDRAGEVAAISGLADESRIASAWATALGLVEADAQPGCVEYTGTVEGLHATVWAVVDRDLFEHNN